MKYENSLRLAKLASRDVHNGGAAALTLAKRAYAITGSAEAEDIVTTVYTHPSGRACYECRECGQEHLTQDSVSECCARGY